jgi:N-acetylglutamate synthase-like GNAT family acetyltransferase
MFEAWRFSGAWSLDVGASLVFISRLNSEAGNLNSAAMTSTNYRLRRATLDDLGALKPLWESMRFATEDLEKRLTEFQVAENAQGEVVGAIGFRLSGRHGCLHSESYSDFSVADAVRPLIWDRLQVLSSNHGVARLWTQENAPFWNRQGFQTANEANLKNLPDPWKNDGPPWLTLQVKSEEAFVSLEKELGMLMQAEKARTNKMYEQARVIKFIATLIAIVFAVFVIGAVFFLMRKNGGTLMPHR